ncbi:alpha/beta hydrolase family protein [Amycolatopsis nigrescens]|uniref:alpha/beta hydrolase family protein n=1 Tax=Amycolatopsis nigrescens TaxID=381445 RepID=UPI00035E8863|nr:alpha/beta hydrolase [Amycolatopsis nigrescens]
MRRNRAPRRRASRIGAAIMAGGLFLTAPVSQAAGNPHQRGPDPTPQSIVAEKGPFEVATAPAPAGNGFGGGTIYYPTDTSQGTFAGIAISPGFFGPQFSIDWYGPRLASQGFVVIAITTNALWDFPSQRADQLLAALKYLKQDSPAKDRLDGGRLGVMGHSMGGGGTMEAVLKDHSLKAAIPLTGWGITADYSGVQTPTMIIGAQFDVVAPDESYSIPFYKSLRPDLDKQFLQLAGGTHFSPNLPNTTIAKYSISWLKRFLDDDTRYQQFLCPVQPDPELSAHEATCHS